MSARAPAGDFGSPQRFISIEALSGIVLLLASALALGWANSPWAAAYERLWHFAPGLLNAGLPVLGPAAGLRPALSAPDLHFLVNDGLMTDFFLVVGLEIRRELHDGALSDAKVAALPLIAAAGGVIVPALFYLIVNTDAVTRRGWAIPTATDIAFAVGVLSLAGKAVPPALRMLLLTLAIVDDIAAILVIAGFYSTGIAAPGLLLVAAGVLGVLALQWLGVERVLAYVLPGVLVWLGMLEAGLHPTLAGVLLGLLTPATPDFGRARRRAPREPATQPPESPAERIEAALHPWVAFGIMPLFALANAGVALAGLDLRATAPLAVSLGVVAGLVLGKPLGIVTAAIAAVRGGLCALPEGVRPGHLALLGLLGGIGFTMSIFIASLAFGDASLLAAAKFAVLAASALAAGLALALGRLLSR